MRWADLLARARRLAGGDSRRILGITGCPGAGKSTVARRLVDALGGAAVPPEVALVVTEGNYLLLDTAPWSAIRALLDEVWFLAPDE